MVYQIVDIAVVFTKYIWPILPIPFQVKAPLLSVLYTKQQ